MSMLANSNAIESVGYNINRSLRFRSSASAYLSRTFGADIPTFTLSIWCKRGALGTVQEIAGSRLAGVASNIFSFDGSDRLYFEAFNTAIFTSTAVFRDPSAWYHIVLRVTTSGTAYGYVNGVQVASGSVGVNSALFKTGYTNVFGRAGDLAASYFDGYLAEVNFIDGQALTPSSFGQTDPVTGVWTPKKYTGTYGTNGFYLDFKDNTSATTLAYDKSGNSNNWTPNNISTTAGATYDSMTDVPTLTSATASNFAVWNPINNGLGGTVSNANLTLSGVSAVSSRINSTIGVSAGKWYFETTLTTAGDYTTVGIGQGNITNQYPGNDALSYAQTLERATSINNNTQPSYGTALISGDVFMCAFDLDNNKVFFGKNGTWFGTSNPETGANPAYSITAGTYNAIARPNPSGFSTTAVLNENFGQRPFSYTPPTGFKALNTFNLPDPTIKKGNQYMDATTYTGNGSTQTITNSGSMQPDFIWIKDRSVSSAHALTNSVVGITKYLESNTTLAETTDSTSVTAINSNGFSLGAGTSTYYTNRNGEAFVAWQWKAGGTAVTNTAGSITSQVSANPTSGFSVVTWSTPASGAYTVGHGLGVAPKFFVIKTRNAVGDWVAYHASLGAGYNLILNTAAGQNAGGAGFWNSTAPSSSVLSIGSNVVGSYTIVAYCFSEIAGYSKFGSFVGNNSADGPFVYCGFRPKYILRKIASAAGNWTVEDTSRATYNEAGPVLFPDTSNAENSATDIDILSNGFKIRKNDVNSWSNASGATYIYAAFAENPFKYSNAR